MRFLTLSTTGIFNAIRPSLFPPIEGKETTTFLLALEYNFPMIPFLEDDTEEVKAAREDLALERQRIRAFVKALCNHFGKPIEELRTEVISCLPEFIKHGTYDGEALLSKPRKGSYRVYPMYKSYRGRKMLFKKHRSPKDEAQYIHDHMLRYFLNRFFSTDGLCGCMTGVDHIDTPLSVTTVQQILEDVEHASMPDSVSVSSIPNTYTMNEPTLINSEFLLIADALGAYMVQGMEGETESEQLANLTKDTFFSDICESLYKHFIFISDCSKIAVYDEWNIWVDKLLDIYSRNQYSQLQRLLQDEVPSYNDGVIGYVKNYHIGPLLDRLVNDLTRNRLKIPLYPKPDQRQSYLDFIIAYGSSIQSIVEGICKQGGDGSDIYKYQDLATVLTLDSRLCCTFYCMIDACCAALNKYMYAAIIPIVDKLDEKTIGFQIGPRLNALGRLGDATPGVQLMTTFDDEEAATIVDFMQSENERRQAIVNQIVEEATPLIQEQMNQPILVLAQPGWHEGVLGIVASRIVEQTGKPTLVLGISEDGLTAKGSGRSFGEFNLYDALTSVKDHLLKFGGHHMAAGLTVETIMLPTIIEGLEQYAKDYQDLLDTKATLTIDEVLPLKDISVEWIDSLASLKPFGTDNPEPVVSLEGIQVASTQLLGVDKQHLKLNLKESNSANTLQAMAFSKGEWAASLQPDTKISIAGTLEINEWQNNRLPQLMVKDIAVKGRVVIDWRTSKITKDHLAVENALYLATNDVYLKELETRIPSTSSVMDFASFVAANETPTAKAIVLFDLPEKIEEVEAFFKMEWTQPLYVITYTKNSVVTTGIPDKPKFGLVYKYIQSHVQIPYNEKLVSVAGFLKIPVEQFRVILKVFFELEFVKIVDGHLMINKSPKTNDLEESTLLKKLNEQMLLEKKFNYSQFQELKSWMDSQQGK